VLEPTSNAGQIDVPDGVGGYPAVALGVIQTASALPRPETTSCRCMLVGVAPASEIKSGELADMLARLEDQMRRMREDFDARLDAIADAIEMGHADDEAAALAAERIRSGAAERTRDGVEVLAELGITAP
jgi:hypothetical protein